MLAPPVSPWSSEVWILRDLCPFGLGGALGSESAVDLKAAKVSRETFPAGFHGAADLGPSDVACSVVDPVMFHVERPRVVSKGRRSSSGPEISVRWWKCVFGSWRIACTGMVSPMPLGAAGRVADQLGWSVDWRAKRSSACMGGRSSPSPPPIRTRGPGWKELCGDAPEADRAGFAKTRSERRISSQTVDHSHRALFHVKHANKTQPLAPKKRGSRTHADGPSPSATPTQALTAIQRSTSVPRGPGEEGRGRFRTGSGIFDARGTSRHLSRREPVASHSWEIEGSRGKATTLVRHAANPPQNLQRTMSQTPPVRCSKGWERETSEEGSLGGNPESPRESVRARHVLRSDEEPKSAGRQNVAGETQGGKAHRIPPRTILRGLAHDKQTTRR